MRGHVVFGSTQRFELTSAILVYEHAGVCFATVHGIEDGAEDEPPVLRAGQALGLDFLQALIRGLGGGLAPEILPDNVLSRTQELICWYTPARVRPMFFRRDDEGLAAMSGQMYPHPALVWKATHDGLCVRALASDARPKPSTELFAAPYWNTYPRDGSVCLGSMRSPSALNLDTYEQWERAFFESAFTHAATAGRLTRHPKGFLAMWAEVTGQSQFPAGYLHPVEQDLADFVGAGKVTPP